ncbi:O-methyltransferase [Chondromyces apiculatus]|uniref:O-methyltransferase n=1 Tax=Chondromyces apiculatus DSM 436 TaxID=1192034 RepID=A0A017T1J3_9BACT|nr:class I SAM-dependent methyltransferase [Chondromyces apiculatus]EYF02720.1 O-methyltransferase [Chondromyces apiculatus DSM 436]
MRATSTLQSPAVKNTLDRLFQDAAAGDPAIIASLRDHPARNGAPTEAAAMSELMRNAYLPVPREVGQLLYILASGVRARTIVEFGTSFAISTTFLAAALRDNGGGKVIATELHPEKVKRARQNLADAGLADLVEIREGDARETLRDLEGPIDMVLLDGWKDLYLPVLQMLEPRLRPGALIAADNMSNKDLRPYADYLNDPQNGYVSVLLPLGDKVEVSCWVGRGDAG